MNAGKALHAHPVELFDGIEDTLAALAERARLVLVTKGDLFHQETKLAASGVGDYFSGIEIVSDKKPETFADIFARNGVEPGNALMAGDSMRSDVFPALEAGAWASWLSGSGPTIAALCDPGRAEEIAAALPATGHVKLLRIDHEGVVALGAAAVEDEIDLVPAD